MKRGNPRKMGIWTSEMDVGLLRAWDAGYFSRDIALALNSVYGTSFTRNAVIGRHYRLTQK